MEPTPPPQNAEQPPQGGGYPPAQGGYPPPGPGGYPPGQNYPQYPGSTQLPYQPPGTGGTSTPAVVGFVLSLFGGGAISVILCIVALNRIPQRNQRGKGFAIAGLVISGLWVAAIIAIVAVSINDGEPGRDSSGQVTTTQTTRPDKLRVGDCVTSLSEGEVKDLQVQPCEQPNGGKVFAVFELPAGPWPGLASVQADAEKGCTDRFKALNQPAAKPSAVFFLHPVENGWALGDRGTTCLLVPK
ncbi:DUF4190 domain-containing protein [Kribbella sp. CA-293567]|uniref:DUF4190 domain-containing protein n=1 Tax=Kribbella sp. CA-293567 TaxID=3002436 RepID=UPI0022DCF4C5|nr:DUF4190 domain-containing protein [Kribbella sp. CA-293567]WBQ07187.1 DUF4190 domain-containing protein [Kribbella sp. CA-293567]